MATLPESDKAAIAESEAAASGEKESGEKKPAARKVRGQVFINEERCKGCALCITFCPSHVLERADKFNAKGYHPPAAVKPDDCTGCDICGYFCPDFAIYGVRLTSKESGKEPSKEETKR
jgi:2-oxoglutarate ferredoxin oxidoreductase subunit delta